MERTTFSVLFFIRRTRLNKHGEAPVEMRLTINGVRIDHALKRSVPPDLWNSEKGRALPRTRECRELNSYLDTAKLRLLQLQREMELDGVTVTSKGLLDKYLGIDDAPRRTLLKVFREHNDKCAKLSGIGMSPATVERYETSYKHTAAFIAAVYGKKDVWLDDVNHKFIVDYEFYLKTERRCAHNTATKYLKNFKKIIRIALANEWIAKDPFANIKFRLDEVDRDFLEEHELKRVMEKSLPIERLAQVRDAFVFACFTGLAFSDLQRLREEHLVRDSDGRMWIRKKRQKTKTSYFMSKNKTPMWFVVVLIASLIGFVYFFTKPQNSTRNIEEHVSEYIDNSVEIEINDIKKVEDIEFTDIYNCNKRLN